MKFLTLLFATLLLSTTTWIGDFTAATTQAAKEGKLIMINFSGSDWCGPCIRLRKEILESAAFETYAQDHLVLVRADFPRAKKNQLDAAQVKRNEALADKYNPKGKFPYTLLVNKDGKVLKAWDGYPNETPDQFVDEIHTLINAGN